MELMELIWILVFSFLEIINISIENLIDLISFLF